LKDSLLIPLLFNTHYDLIINQKYFRNLITEYFEKIDFKSKKPRMIINYNDIIVYNGIEIPKSIIIFESITINNIKNGDKL
jgi:hypothetical protein